MGARPLIGRFWPVVALAFVMLWGSSAMAAPAKQGEANGAFFAMTPIAGTGAGELQTHTADIVLAQEGASLVAAVDGLYRVQNATDEAVTLLVRIDPQPEGGGALPAAVTLAANGQPLTLQPGENDSLTGQVSLPADGRVNLRLRYGVNLGEGPLVDLAYDATHVRAWTGTRSLRVAFDLPAALAPETWLDIAPADWSDLAGSENGVKWLYDGVLPDQPMQISFIHPDTWARLTTAENAAVPGAAPAAFLALGDLYRALYDQAGGRAAVDRFYAQALAAYTAGVEAAAGDAGAAAPLNAGLASLYRSRVVSPDGRTAPAYARLMTGTAQLAATGLPPDSARRAEMLRWQQEGLALQLIDARGRRDWVGALALLDQLAALPAELVDPARIAQDRRAVEIQQALQLLEQGDRSAALALAGEGIADIELAPPAASQSLFTSWEGTVRAGVDGAELHFVGHPAVDDGTALAALAEQVARWRDAGLPRGVRVELKEAGDGRGTIPVELTISLPADTRADSLALLLSGGPQWAMLRSVLEQTDLEVEQSGRLFWQESTLRQTLNLAPVADQWQAMAANLQRDAAQFEAQAAALAADPATGEDALRAEIQAANYRNAAAVWEDLARGSWVVTTLTAPSRLDTLARSWLTTVDAPAQVMEYSAQSVNVARLLLVAILGVVALLLLAFLLWRLL
jgi:hypothetical protein